METRTKPKERLVHLDFARAVAIAAVLVIHFLAHSTGTVVQLFGGTANLTMISSPLFFAVSGASLACSTPREKAMSLGMFIRKRFLRIFPVFYIAYAFATAIHFLIDRTIAVGVPAWHIVFSFVGFDGLLLALGVPTFYMVGEWFLGCIIGVYALFPLLHWIWRKSVVTLAIIGGVLVIATAFNIGHSWAFYLFMPIASFIFGMLVFSRKPSWIGASIAVAVVAGLWITAPNLGPDFMNIVYGCACVYILFYIGQFLKYVPLAPDFFAWVGAISFSIILTHHFIFYQMLMWFHPTSVRNIIVYIVIVCAMVAVASVLLSRAEKWIIAWFSGLGRRWETEHVLIEDRAIG